MKSVRSTKNVASSKEKQLDLLAQKLQALTESELETLEILLEPNTEKELIARSQEAEMLHKTDQALKLADLK